MSSTLPDLLNPRQAVASQAEYAGTLPLSGFSRLREELWDADGDLRFRLAFARDAKRRGVVRGELRTRLRLICQRCLGPLDHGVDLRIELALVSGPDEARGLPERYDALVATGEPIRTADLLEDELLLALPQIPMHPADACAAQALAADLDGEAEETAEAHPFAALADWKHRPGS